MKQANPHYAILGDGRLARHMRRYLNLLGLAVSGWSRRQTSDFNSHGESDAETRLRHTLEPASHVLLLVADGAIGHLLKKYPFLHGRRLVHCAGALSFPGVAGAHPLMTFGRRPYGLDEYRRIPFVVDEGYSLERLIPGLPNPWHSIAPHHKPLYHALCVMAGNFPQLLWLATADRLEAELRLPSTILEPYLQRVLDNFLKDSSAAMTGPLSRDDKVTLERNLAALDGDAMGGLYRAFVAFHEADGKMKSTGRQPQEESS